MCNDATLIYYMGLIYSKLIFLLHDTITDIQQTRYSARFDKHELFNELLEYGLVEFG